MIASGLRFDHLPFYWRMLDHFGIDRLGIPDDLPFELSYRQDLQLVIQRESPVVQQWLQRIYREDANVGYLQEGHALSVRYGNEFMRFLDQAIAALPAAPRTAMELGCGGIYLLKLLHERGMEVCGVDPSPVSKLQADRAGIELISEFYPSPNVRRRVDLMFHHNVLEHVADPVDFLRVQHANLVEGGMVVTAVPDCSPSIQCGDVSMVIHEHLAYFDADSLSRTFSAAGYRDVVIGRASQGGVLYGAGRSFSGSGPTIMQGAQETAKYDLYCDRAKSAVERFRAYAGQALASRDGLGIYVPLRALPYLAAIGLSERVRFFDDDPGIHAKYFPGLDIRVENFDDLVARPVSQLLVCSFSFGRVIAEKVRSRLGAGIDVTVLPDLLTPEGMGRPPVN